MGLFGKKKKEEEIVEDIEDSNLKEELKEDLKTEVENLQTEFRLKQDEVNEITQKVQTVKEEYDITVGNLMAVKKELNQKKMELDIAIREYKETREKIKNAEQINVPKPIKQPDRTDKEISDAKEELGKITKELDEIIEQIAKEQNALHSIRKQQLEAQKELDDANSRLYNAKEELEKKDYFQDTSILTTKEKEFIQGENESKQSSAGIIEAASVVVGSLKSKLSMTQKELETIQVLLEKEREGHEKTKQELKRFKEFANKIKES